MNLPSHHTHLVVRTALDEIIHTHGFWPVLKALLVRTIRRAPATVDETPLSNHLRRDIGLQPVARRDPFSVSRR